MGAYSTIDLTREQAISMIYEALERSDDETFSMPTNPEDATDEELGEALTELLCEKTCHNYRIVYS